MHTTYNEYIKAYIKGQWTTRQWGLSLFLTVMYPLCGYGCGLAECWTTQQSHCRTQSSVILVLIFILFYPPFTRWEKNRYEVYMEENTTTCVAMCTEIDPKRLKRTVAEVLTTLLHCRPRRWAKAVLWRSSTFLVIVSVIHWNREQVEQ